jgi:cytochrome c oxidase assembly factor CtaG
MRAAIQQAALTPLGSFATQPLIAWLAATVAVIGWHVPAAFELAQRSAFWHEIQDASFLVSGLLFWWPVIQPWPVAERMATNTILLYLFAATLPCDALSAFLVFCDRAIYRHAALADQQTAGAFMWVSITFIYLVPAFVITLRALSPAQQTATM